MQLPPWEAQDGAAVDFALAGVARARGCNDAVSVSHETFPIQCMMPT
jgi:hypothetical protein